MGNSESSTFNNASFSMIEIVNYKKLKFPEFKFERAGYNSSQEYSLLLEDLSRRMIKSLKPT